MFGFSGKILGGTLLIAGSCIGAGMLGLPIVMGLLGFFPSLILLFLAWAFMTFTSLLLLEVNGIYYVKNVNLISMAEKSLGFFGKILSFGLYLFLFYSLLVAYVAASGSMGSSFLPMSKTIISILFSAVLGAFVFFGTKTVDRSNRVLMIGKIGFYLAMLFLGLSNIHFENLSTFNEKYFLLPLPILVISFGYHNMIPSIVSYMEGDVFKVKKAILAGSLLSLIVYIFWILMIVGTVGQENLLSSYKEGKEISSTLKTIIGSSKITAFAAGFSACALLTAFLAQSLALSHFLKDGFKMSSTKKNHLFLILLTIVPPTILAVVYPTIFFQALNFAGGICAIILFGALPILMVYKGRYVLHHPSSYSVKGGKLSLLIALGFTLIVLGNEIFSLF